jgi:hypothetical protein
MSGYSAHPGLNDRRLQITEVNRCGHPARSLPPWGITALKRAGIVHLADIPLAVAW